ncbi:hypothetical protein CAPN004_21710 [Capnocytophaga cynodegmi]|uniref:glycosyltransferase n=1 Tax=Capnocytophaga cynodegmi TaxID=28189 RepID=UPI001ACF1E97|nr:glycosyltransferase [Capnocytophaga cynodegmi]GIM53141.1 hypothetical protein CAPN004_21710 [Capnocytophaga cynodegmi]
MENYNIYFVDYYNPAQNLGVNSYVTQLTKGISKYPNINIFIVLVEATHNKEIKEESSNGVDQIYIPYDLYANKRIGENDEKAIQFFIEKTKNQSNIIFHFNWMYHTPFGFFLKQKIKCATVLTKHYEPWRNYNIANYPLFYRVNNVLKKNSPHNFVFKDRFSDEITYYNSVDHIITVTQDAKKVLSKLFEISESKITTIYNGVELKNIKQKRNKEKLRKKYHFPTNEKIILFAGRLTQEKGIGELTQAFEKLIKKHKQEKYRLVFCGKGDHNIACKYINHYPNITFSGNIDKKQLYDFYAMADVGVVPSYFDQCSYTVIEMMANKLPVIISDVEGLNELIDNKYTGLKTKISFTSQKTLLNVNDLANNILSITTNNHNTAKLVKNAYSKVCSSLTVEKMAEQTISVYKSIFNHISEKNKVKCSDLVSVIIPCHNGEKYIKECLQSVLNQTYENIEVIVIDDASQDDTYKIISEINDNRLKIIRNKNNKGIVYSLNKGINVAQGEYIARLDIDDYMIENRIELQVNFLNKNKQYGLVGSNHILVDENSNLLQYCSYPESNEDIQIMKYFMNPISHPTVLCRASIFDEFKYNDEYADCEDYALWFDISKKYKIANIPQYTVFHRIHPESVSSKSTTQQEVAFRLIWDELDKLGINTSKEELRLHMAIFTNKRTQFFDSPEKIKELKNWIDKMTNHLDIKDISIKNVILHYCDVWE